MASVVFDKAEFESALPVHKATGAKLWYPVTVTGTRPVTEYTYAVVVSEENGVVILVQSSIRVGHDTCDGTGSNSIRCWLSDSIDYMPLQGRDCKPQRWVARTRGWRDNMTRVLRTLFVTGSRLGTCSKCRVGVRKLYRSQKEQSKGQLFISCSTKSCYFSWLEQKENIQ